PPSGSERRASELLRPASPSHIALTIKPLADGMTYIIAFSGPEVIGGSVPDGSYTLITFFNKVHVLSGPPLTSNDVNTFSRLFGDANGDGVVNGKDLALLQIAETHRNSPYAPVSDYTGNGVIDREDTAQFSRRSGADLGGTPRRPPSFPGRGTRHASPPSGGFASM